MKKITILMVALMAIGCESGVYDVNFPEMNGDYEPSYTPDDGDQITDYGENSFISTAEQAVSTFSVDADGASYCIMRAYLNWRGSLSPYLRTEEFVNYFTYDYPEPSEGHTISLSHEMTVCPWNQEHRLLRIGLKGAALEAGKEIANNYVFLADVSGSMATPLKLDLLKDGLLALSEHLTANDRISLITYSGNVNTLLECVPGDQHDTIREAINRLVAGGSTNGGDALRMAYALARTSYIEGGNNRVIIGTDGDFNVGMTSTEELVAFIEEQLDANIYLSVMGFGLGMNDSMMESIARHGNGTYEFIDCADEVAKVYVNERNKFHTVAKDTKIKVEFSSTKVEKWRLIGYENRIMSEEEFEDSKKDAGEIGADQTITALYELVPALDSDFLQTIPGQCTVHYKTPNDGSDHTLVLDIHPYVAPLEEASSEIKWAASLAAMNMLSRESAYAGQANVEMVRSLAEQGAQGPSVERVDPFGYRASHLKLLDKWEEAMKMAGLSK